MRKKAIVLLVLSMVLVFLCGCNSNKKTAEDTAESFLSALAVQNYDTAKSLATGEALFNIVSSIKKGIISQPAIVVDLSIKTQAISNEWAVLEAVTELELKGGNVDVTWYNLEILKKDGAWKIARVKPLEPQIYGKGKVAATDVDEAKSVFEKYLASMSENEWQEAANNLAGPARISQELSREIIGKSNIINQVSNVTLEPLWSANAKKTLVCRANYDVDGHSAELVITFYRTSQGMKIVGIVQC